MKLKHLIALACVAAVLTAIAIRTSKKNHIQQPTASVHDLVFKDLPVNDITRIDITTFAGQMEIKRTDKGWIAPDKFGYPVMFQQVKDVLMGLMDLKTGEKRDIPKDQLAEVKLLSPKDESAAASGKGSLVELYTSGNTPVASLLIGTDRMKADQGGVGNYPDGKFISPDNGARFFVTSFYIPSIEDANIISWLDSTLLSVRSSITNIQISVHGQKPFSLHSDGAGSLTLDKLSRKEKMDENKPQSLLYCLSGLRFDDVADPALDNKALGFDEPSTFTATTDQTEQYTVTIGGSPEGSKRRYVRISAKYTGDPLAEEPKSDDANANSTEEDTKKKDAIQRVNTVKEKLTGWTYIVDESKVAAMLSKRDDLVAKKDD